MTRNGVVEVMAGDGRRAPAPRHRGRPRGADPWNPATLRSRALRSSPRMPDPDEITIVLADDHAVVRAGLRLLLDQAGGLRVVSEAGDAESALRTVLGHKPAILVLDLNMPGELTSLDAIPRVREVSPTTRVVVLTMQDDPQFARRALRAGAAGYVLKEAADDELVEAVRRVAEGGTYLNPRLGAALAAAPPEPSGPPDDLTER